MFYTKYRPQKFSEISRPNETADALMRQLMSNKTIHAYLFVGSRGTGKTTTARILAKALNCENLGKNGDPCDVCKNCVSVKLGKFLDLIEIDAASNRGIDDIRDLKDKIKLAPSSGKHKVYIIDEVHMLTTEAFNALLKTLEEPPKNTVFILCTTEVSKVPDTIKSRCQVFKFKRATVSQLSSKLRAICLQEEVSLADDKIRKIAEMALGGFRDAETILQQVVEGGIDVDSLLVANAADSYPTFVGSLTAEDVSRAFHTLENIFKDGLDIYVWSGGLLKYLRDLLFSSVGVTELIDTTGENLSKIQEQAIAMTPATISTYLSVFTKAHNEIKSSFIPQLPLELAVVEICDKKGHLFRDSVVNSSGPLNTSSPIKIVAPVVVPQLPTGNVTMEDVTGKWSSVLTQLASVNSSVVALLKSTELVSLEEDTVFVEAFYSFHKERLENPKNKKIIEDVFDTVFGEKLGIKCRLSDKKPARLNKREVGNLTDYNVVTSGANAGSLVEVFDGGLPL